MDKCLKYKTIDIMKQLLDYGKMLPFFTVEFDIIANNKFIEEHIISNAVRTNYEGEPLSDDEIQDNIYNAIKLFHNSKGYNGLGVSTLSIRKIFTLQSISYDAIYEIVSGDCKSLPNGYKFVGEMKLVNLDSEEEA